MKAQKIFLKPQISVHRHPCSGNNYAPALAISCALSMRTVLSLSLSPPTPLALQTINHDSDLAVRKSSHSLGETCNPAFSLTLPCPTFTRLPTASLHLTTYRYFLPEGGSTWRGLEIRDIEGEAWAPTQCYSGWASHSSPPRDLDFSIIGSFVIFVFILCILKQHLCKGSQLHQTAGECSMAAKAENS